MARERSTVEHMIKLYCKGKHQPQSELCQDCRALLKYVGGRLGSCPFQDEKPTCLNCQVHCFEPEMREKIKNVMRYSGPRMLLRHPLLTLRHILDGRSGKGKKKAQG